MPSLPLARGDLSGVARAIEFGLSKLIVLVIGLFAKLIGLGGLAQKVQKIFKKIRKRVDTAITKLLKKAKAAGGKIMRALGLGKKGEKKKNKDIKTANSGDEIESKEFKIGKENHSIFVENGNLMMASNKMRLANKLKSYETESKNPKLITQSHYINK